MNQNIFIFSSCESFFSSHLGEISRLLFGKSRSKHRLSPPIPRCLQTRFTTFSFFSTSFRCLTAQESTSNKPSHWTTAMSGVIGVCCHWLEFTSVSGVHVCTFTPPARPLPGPALLGGNRYFPSCQTDPDQDKTSGTYASLSPDGGFGPSRQLFLSNTL